MNNEIVIKGNDGIYVLYLSNTYRDEDIDKITQYYTDLIGVDCQVNLTPF